MPYIVLSYLDVPAPEALENVKEAIALYLEPTPLQTQGQVKVFEVRSLSDNRKSSATDSK